MRVAEEMAWLDCLSGGRIEMGLVKGAPYEIAPANSNPGRLMRRYWEAHDLIIKALSTTTGPFSWEGEFYRYPGGEHLAASDPAADAADLDDRA